MRIPETIAFGSLAIRDNETTLGKLLPFRALATMLADVRVIVSGAGLGGLVLAHALRDHADVVVVDRDLGPEDTGGYRIALTPEAVAVIERYVPERVVQRLRDVSDGPDTFAQFTIANDRLRPIVVAPQPSGQDRLLCQRRALRTILCETLGDVVRFGAEVVSATASAAGASVTIANGSVLEGDVVVAADGTQSPTIAAIAGRPTSHDLGLTGIAGSAPLTGVEHIPRYLTRGPALAIDHRGTGMFLSLASRHVGPVPPELASVVGPPSLVWGLIARTAALGPIDRTDAAQLAGLAMRSVERWHPWMRTQIERTDPTRTSAYTFRAASTHGPRFPWAASRITAIGDAIHAMPPTGGRAGSTAILSAGALADTLLHTPEIDKAVAQYQGRVDEWAVPAIRESLGPVRIIQTLRHPATRVAAQPLLAAAGAVRLALQRPM